jgi:hypothetical protein
MYQSICCPNADHIMNPHHCELPQTQYQKLLRTEMLNEMSYWENTGKTADYLFK